MRSGRGSTVLAGGRHRRADAGDVAAGQQDVPVEPLEHQLAEVVQPRLLQQRQADPAGKCPGSGSVS